MTLAYNQSIGCLYRHKCYWRYHYHLLTMSMHGVSMIFGVAFRIIKGQSNHVNLQSEYRPPFWGKMLPAMSQTPPNNEHCRSVKHFWSCILDDRSAMQWHQPIFTIQAPFIGQNAGDNIATTSWKWASPEPQQFLVLDLVLSKWYATALTYNQSISCHQGKNASDDITTASSKWVPTEGQQFFGELIKLHSNELQCIVPKLTYKWSVFSICLCIQLHKYACNFSQIWLFLLVALESIFKNQLSTLL